VRHWPIFWKEKGEREARERRAEREAREGGRQREKREGREEREGGEGEREGGRESLSNVSALGTNLATNYCVCV
jgi:hypothetical protein